MEKRFFDEARVYFQAGNGGNGCCSFRRVKYIPRGGPDGGNGGKGGDIILIAKNNLNSLLYFHYNVHHRAGNGKSGSGQNMTGANGDDKVLAVPIGTQIYDENENIMFADLNREDESYTIVKGGQGGMGNMAFKTSINQTPRKATPGEEGQKGWFTLKLKMLSDVGVVGLPNAGKSSLISTITNAKIEVADYPFTTIKPTLGVVKCGRGRFVICDIPGLIKGASSGAGLGDKFLKHIERCKILIHIIDITSDSFIDDYKTIKKELIQYNKDILKKNIIVVFNKIDLLDESILKAKIKTFIKETKINPICISTVAHTGLKDLIKLIFNIIKNEI